MQSGGLECAALGTYTKYNKPIYSPKLKMQFFNIVLPEYLLSTIIIFSDTELLFKLNLKKPSLTHVRIEYTIALMEEAVLIIGSNTEIGQALKERFIRSKYKLCTVSIDGTLEKKKKPEALSLKWNSRSPVSASAVMREISNTFPVIKKIFYIFSPAVGNKMFNEQPAALIGSYIDSNIKGNSFLIRELINILIKRKTGEFYSIIHAHGTDSLDPQQAASIGYIKYLFTSIYTGFADLNLHFNGFESSTDNINGFTDYLEKYIVEPNAKTNRKWFRYQEKTSLFDPFKKSRN